MEEKGSDGSKERKDVTEGKVWKEDTKYDIEEEERTGGRKEGRTCISFHLERGRERGRYDIYSWTVERERERRERRKEGRKEERKDGR